MVINGTVFSVIPESGVTLGGVADHAARDDGCQAWARCLSDSRYRSVSMADMQPLPAAVIA